MQAEAMSTLLRRRAGRHHATKSTVTSIYKGHAASAILQSNMSALKMANVRKSNASRVSSNFKNIFKTTFPVFATFMAIPPFLFYYTPPRAQNKEHTFYKRGKYMLHCAQNLARVYNIHISFPRSKNFAFF